MLFFFVTLALAETTDDREAAVSACLAAKPGWSTTRESCSAAYDACTTAGGLFTPEHFWCNLLPEGLEWDPLKAKVVPSKPRPHYEPPDLSTLPPAVQADILESLNQELGEEERRTGQKSDQLATSKQIARLREEQEKHSAIAACVSHGREATWCQRNWDGCVGMWLAWSEDKDRCVFAPALPPQP